MSLDWRVLMTAPMSSNTAAFITAPILFVTLSSTLSSSSLPSSTTIPVLEATPSPSSQCYFPNGKSVLNYDYNYQPCGGRNTTWQQCCDFETDICTENGLCTHLEDNTIPAYEYRAGCMNADWSGCPQVCLDVKQCPSGEYCCNPETATSDCCLDDSRQFGLSDHNPNAKNATGAAGSGNEGGKNGTDASGGVGGNTTTQMSDGNNGRKTDRVMIGASVGGALGGLAMIGGAVGMWLHLRKKRGKQGRETIAQDETDVESPEAMDPREMKQVLEVGTNPMVEQKYSPGSDVKDHSVVMEMDSTAVYELGV
ncbi:hypothetical protein GGI43DRAFT_426986 [Trichoderma evansii]